MTAQQLKNSILQMAVQGKLVPQDPNDEPASVLLERIKAEKEALIKSGKIKKSKKSSEIFRGASRTLPYTFCEQIGKEIRDISDEIPFEIPESWEWCRLGICLDVRDGTHDTPKYVPQGIPLVTSKNLRNGHVDFSTAKLISVQDHEAISQRSKVDNGDIMFAMIGSIGNPVLYYGDENFSIKNMALFKKIQSGMDMSYVYWFLLLAQDNMKKYASGGVQSFVSLSYLRNYYIPVPPISEQKRIVAKIEELLPFIEKYEQAETKLTALNKSFSEMLKKSILQEAVQGKLVPQNPDDEPASILLERIRAEKQELIRQGKIKKSKHESIIVTRDKIPYEIPDSWAWCTLGSIINLVSGQDFNSCDFNVEGKGIPYLTGASNIIDEKIILNRWTDKPRCIANCGDLLIVCKGAGVGKMCILTEKKVHIARQIMSVQSTIVDIRYIKIFLEHNLILLRKSMQGVIPGISRDIILSMLFPLPPLAEQLRIVSKIEEIMSMINSISK